MPRPSRTVPNPEDDPYGSIGGTGASGALQFSSAGGGLLQGAIDAVTCRGDGVVFSRTSDGGALSIRVLHDSLITKWYCKDKEELDDLLRKLAQVR